MRLIFLSGDSVFLPTNQAGSITTNFNLAQRGGIYANEVGYYRVDDAAGRIGNLRPGDLGYAAAALAANPDGFDHLQASFASDNANNANGNGKLTLKWEDMTNGGDKDFDDVVFTATGFKSAGGTVFTYDVNATDADDDKGVDDKGVRR